MTFNISENEQKILELSISNISRGVGIVGKAIDGLTSSSLKRVLKTVAHVHVGESIVLGKDSKLNETENVLIDKIFALQEEILGYTTLRQQLEQRNTIDIKGEENVEQLG